MCGIVGVLRLDGRSVDEAQLRAMRDSMLHRGPDDGGLYVDGVVGLGHRRLSIVDLSPAGHQPMTNEDGSIWLVFNGEIYNYIELGARLRQRGHTFRSHTDSEVILHLYEEMGERCVEELNGMFGFVLWDGRRNLLFGARDRLGIKPFYYCSDARQFVCASEIKAILADPDVRRAPDHGGIADYLFAGAPLASKTFFEGIAELPPGHTISVSRERHVVRKYWDVAYEYNESRSLEEVTHLARELLDDSVRIHCRSDAPLGSHLSGGIDSSTVASIAAQHVNALKTFSIRFAGGDMYDESRFARSVSRSVGTVHEESVETPELLRDIYPWLLWHMDQPPAGGGDGGFSYYAAAALASRHVKVALTGHGGDEIFAGYPAQFQLAGIAVPPAGHNPRAAQPSFGARLANVVRREGLRGVVRRLGARLSSRPSNDPARLWMRLHCSEVPATNRLLDRRFVRGLGGYSPVDEYLRPFRNAPTDRMLDRCLYHDLRVYLPQLLHKEDRASMAVSIESRVPLLDYRIVEFLATVPPAQKLPDNVPKSLLRRAASPWLPPEVQNRRDKVPFLVPIKEWLGGMLAPLATELALSPASLDRGIFNADILRRRLFTQDELLAILNIELWFRIYIDNDPAWTARSQAYVRDAGRTAPTAPPSYAFGG
jgi:asparagine synthase (glutamine-hydrolysing)